MKECSIYPPRPALPRLARKTGSTLAPHVRWPTTAEQALSHLLAAHRPAPVCSRVDDLIRGAEWLITLLHKFDSYERAKTARKNAARSSACQLTAPKPAWLPCDARGERSGTYGCPCALRARTAVCGPSPRCPLFAGAVRRHRELDLTTRQPRRHNTRPPRPHD